MKAGVFAFKNAFEETLSMSTLPRQFLSVLRLVEHHRPKRGRDVRRHSDSLGGSAKEARRPQGISSTLLRALNHPVRRETLRVLHRSPCPKSAIQLSHFIAVSGTMVSYHLKVLAELGAVTRVEERRVRGAREKFFVSEVARNRRIVAILADVEGEDDGMRR
jgi:DNA-binding transcriptional ArsR family regulator